ncbi:MAG: ATP-binding protein [Sarcina sp.]
MVSQSEMIQINRMILLISIILLIYSSFRANKILTHKYNNKKQLIFCVILIIVIIGIEIAIYKKSPRNSLIFIMIGFIVQLIFLYKNPLREKLLYVTFAYFMIFTINAFILSVTIVLCTFDIRLENFIYAHCRIIQLIAFIVLYLIIENNLNKFWKSEYLFKFVSNSKKDLFLKIAYILVITISILGMLSVRRLDLGEYLVCFYYYIVILLFAFMIALIVKINFNTKEYLIFTNSKKMEIKYLNDNLNILSKRELEQKILYHDMKHHIFAIKYLVENRELERANNYIKSLELEFKEVDNKKITGNIIINGIILEKIKSCTELGIKNNFNVVAKENLKISDSDLASLISNILDNAIEGVQRVDNEEKFINVDLKIDAQTLILKVKNTSEANVNMSKTSKIEFSKHGFGIKSIMSIIKKYDGNISFDNANKIFTVVVYIPF